MEYKGYTARVVFDEDAGVLFGEVEGLRDVVTFEATDAREIEAAFRDSVDDYLEMCRERGEDPERPYSGRFLVRVDPALHRDVAFAAARAGKSLNAFTTDLLRSWLTRTSAAMTGRSPATVRSRPVAPKQPNAAAKELNLDVFNYEKPTFLEREPAGVPVHSRQTTPAVLETGPDLRYTPGSITPRQEPITPGPRTPRQNSLQDAA